MATMKNRETSNTDQFMKSGPKEQKKRGHNEFSVIILE